MKIALLGYGKMGKVIEKIALERGHEIVLRKSAEVSFEGLEQADVAIDFSIPDAAVSNISTCLDNNIPIISGTTGWLDSYDKMVALCQEKNGAFIYGSNFSLGVNIFFQLNDYLAKMMSNIREYKVSMEEIHHTQKLDAPSGTAITLAKGIIENSDYSSWALENAKEDEILIDAKRIENVPGTHSVFYNSNVDTIEIKHIAHSREGFALGAVVAAEWILGRKGVYTMKDVLNLT
ncbi:MAG: 4-hydroxy-tetrahydrodipicolinate reductase [Flavobacterium lindanitolerans]|jgi:4-hydroxy-tetrahydrodipicolinate reductase|uniref:4-hydroxy-tetrahydrodipicolinate reductase n=1 Tax=Flavobacterium TaxID=237 RepID=UPI0007014676|nr:MULTISPECIES: 4-hydroxy-tetrahydrodipicolinate reductase [Flavobacterium]KQS47347.1 4-hydroxy-tetrahydrodipicolinate reductase [Flavobacterium sp. Leaf359]MBL7869720.1 4-hydroxy-tetrahydrodipicolinate reductase [Flavobacterium lindanitolerans]MBU7570310.1 4-hydroxy-tetrahydrodipicolinate reductase [Flavobacterium sp.]PZO34106.1 MAG: 4-hydroxy-tetrahydrodipicolinate reductase [Flavobacteriaceae bacterium]